MHYALYSIHLNVLVIGISPSDYCGTMNDVNMMLRIAVLSFTSAICLMSNFHVSASIRSRLKEQSIFSFTRGEQPFNGGPVISLGGGELPPGGKQYCIPGPPEAI